MYKVKIRKSIWTHNKSDVEEYLNRQNSYIDKNAQAPKVAILIKEISLPFVPFIGLEISSDKWSSGPLKSVSWIDDAQCFFSTVEEEFPHELNDVISPYVSYEDLLKWSIESGWARPKQGGGDAPMLGTDI